LRGKKLQGRGKLGPANCPQPSRVVGERGTWRVFYTWGKGHQKLSGWYKNGFSGQKKSPKKTFLRKNKSIER